MNDRERYLQTVRFGSPDRVPYRFGHARQSTMDAWRWQGLAKDADVYRAVGYDDWRGVPIDLLPVPRFKEVTLEELGDKRIWIDELGAKRIDHKNPATPGFVTRSWLDFPVKSRADFEEMKRRFDPRSPERYPADWAGLVGKSRGRGHVLQLTVYGPFWRVRDWVGFERLCMMCALEPGFVREMFEFTTDFTIETLRGRLRELEVDFVFVSEDMAYKTASMISPAMTRELLVPCWKRLIAGLRKEGAGTFIMDCDGHISELIPIWMDCGFDGVWPVEIAALNDPLAYRRRFGKSFAMLGCIDKRELRFDFKRVRAEILPKVPRLLEAGGFIPGVDHGIPPDVPVRNYLYMCELLKAVCEGSPTDSVSIDRYADILGPVREEWSMELAERLAASDASEES